jgi:hypothetical protein
MALPASGEIHFNEIHIEAGGTTGTQCSLEDTDIRALIGEASLDQHAISEWWGASAAEVTWDTTSRIITGSDDFFGPDVGIRIQDDGEVYVMTNGVSYSKWAYEDWESTATATTGSNYELRWNYVSGSGTLSSTFGTVNTWIDLGTDLTCVLAGASTDKNRTISIEIREDGGTPISKNVQLVSNVN